MRIVIITLIGLLSIFGSCNKDVSVQFKLYLDDSLVVGNWSQISGPTQLTFDNTVGNTVNIIADKPQPGIYVIKAIKDGKEATATINISK